MDYSGRDRGLGRRKACDFCCQRKAKCDAKRPTCSGCELHNVDCLWTPGLFQKKAPSRLDNHANTRRFENIEARLATLESLANRDHATEAPAAFGYAGPSTAAAVFDTSSASAVQAPTCESSSASWSDLGSAERFTLPPQNEVLPLIRNYFANYNRAMPIFLYDGAMGVVHEWYDDPSTRDGASWAAINVMMALSLRHAPTEETCKSGANASLCMSNAQSVMDSLVYREQDVKGLQVLLGLALLFLGTNNPHPACVLVATAVKLTFRLRLHISDPGEPMSESCQAQRSSLFWITYVLDRELSMHAHEPYLLQDHENDQHPFDVSELHNLGETLLFKDHQMDSSYLRYRVDLAHIHGRMHDLVYSVKASKLSANLKKAATERIGRMLEDWRASIPDRFKVENITELDRTTRRHLITLHIAYFQCLFTAHRTQALDVGWIKRLTDFSDGRTQSLRETSPALLPPNWSMLVGAARTCLGLFRLMDEVESALRWGSTCAHQGATTILAANNITLTEHDLHDNIDTDTQLINQSLQEFEAIRVKSTDPRIERVYTVVVDLAARSVTAVTKFRNDPLAGAMWFERTMADV